ncbi:MAG: SHOCT domain-containing protein [Stenotrophomonas sp.]
MKLQIAILLLTVSSTANAKEPTSIGGGQYMLTDQNFTIFGSTDKIVAKLVGQAHKFCQEKNGKEAVLSESGGTAAVAGEINNSGMLRRPAQGATGTVYFKCGQDAPVPTAVATVQPDMYTQLPKLKALLDSGAITQEEYDAQKAKLLGN